MLYKTVRDKSNSLDLRIAQSENAATANRFLVMSNGRSEWIEKYESLGLDLGIGSDTGYVAVDHRGQGASGGARAWVDHYNTYASDLGQMITAGVGDKPFNLVCHSMGCLVALVAIMEGFIKPRCVVLSSPLLGLPHRPFPAPAAYQISSALTKLHLGFLNSGGGRHWKPPFEKNVLTHSPERYQLVQNSPYPVPSPTFSWVKASYEATQYILRPENLAKLTMPVLVLCGTEEKVVDPDAITRWVAVASKHAKSIDFQWIQEGRHELLFESKPLYDTTLNVIKTWFDKKGFPL